MCADGTGGSSWRACSCEVGRRGSWGGSGGGGVVGGGGGGGGCGGCGGGGGGGGWGVVCLMVRRAPGSTRTDTLVPDATLCRSARIGMLTSHRLRRPGSIRSNDGLQN